MSSVVGLRGAPRCMPPMNGSGSVRGLPGLFRAMPRVSVGLLQHAGLPIDGLRSIGSGSARQGPLRLPGANKPGLRRTVTPARASAAGTASPATPEGFEGTGKQQAPDLLDNVNGAAVKWLLLPAAFLTAVTTLLDGKGLMIAGYYAMRYVLPVALAGLALEKAKRFIPSAVRNFTLLMAVGGFLYSFHSLDPQMWSPTKDVFVHYPMLYKGKATFPVSAANFIQKHAAVGDFAFELVEMASKFLLSTLAALLTTNLIASLVRTTAKTAVSLAGQVPAILHKLPKPRLPNPLHKTAKAAKEPVEAVAQQPAAVELSPEDVVLAPDGVTMPEIAEKAGKGWRKNETFDATTFQRFLNEETEEGAANVYNLNKKVWNRLVCQLYDWNSSLLKRWRDDQSELMAAKRLVTTIAVEVADLRDRANATEEERAQIEKERDMLQKQSADLTTEKEMVRELLGNLQGVIVDNSSKLETTIGAKKEVEGRLADAEKLIASLQGHKEELARSLKVSLESRRRLEVQLSAAEATLQTDGLDLEAARSARASAPPAERQAKSRLQINLDMILASHHELARALRAAKNELAEVQQNALDAARAAEKQALNPPAGSTTLEALREARETLAQNLRDSEERLANAIASAVAASAAHDETVMVLEAKIEDLQRDAAAAAALFRQQGLEVERLQGVIETQTKDYELEVEALVSEREDLVAARRNWAWERSDLESDRDEAMLDSANMKKLSAELSHRVLVQERKVASTLLERDEEHKLRLLAEEERDDLEEKIQKIHKINEQTDHEIFYTIQLEEEKNEAEEALEWLRGVLAKTEQEKKDALKRMEEYYTSLLDAKESLQQARSAMPTFEEVLPSILSSLPTILSSVGGNKALSDALDEVGSRVAKHCSPSLLDVSSSSTMDAKKQALQEIVSLLTKEEGLLNATVEAGDKIATAMPRSQKGPPFLSKREKKAAVEAERVEARARAADTRIKELEDEVRELTESKIKAEEHAARMQADKEAAEATKTHALDSVRIWAHLLQSYEFGSQYAHLRHSLQWYEEEERWFFVQYVNGKEPEIAQISPEDLEATKNKFLDNSKRERARAQEALPTAEVDLDAGRVVLNKQPEKDAEAPPQEGSEAAAEWVVDMDSGWVVPKKPDGDAPPPVAPEEDLDAGRVVPSGGDPAVAVDAAAKAALHRAMLDKLHREISQANHDANVAARAEVEAVLGPVSAAAIKARPPLEGVEVLDSGRVVFNARALAADTQAGGGEKGVLPADPSPAVSPATGEVDLDAGRVVLQTPTPEPAAQETANPDAKAETEEPSVPDAQEPEPVLAIKPQRAEQGAETGIPQQEETSKLWKASQSADGGAVWWPEHAKGPPEDPDDAFFRARVKEAAQKNCPWLIWDDSLAMRPRYHGKWREMAAELGVDKPCDKSVAEADDWVPPDDEDDDGAFEDGESLVQIGDEHGCEDSEDSLIIMSQQSPCKEEDSLLDMHMLGTCEEEDLSDDAPGTAHAIAREAGLPTFPEFVHHVTESAGRKGQPGDVSPFPSPANLEETLVNREMIVDKCGVVIFAVPPLPKADIDVIIKAGYEAFLQVEVNDKKRRRKRAQDPWTLFTEKVRAASPSAYRALADQTLLRTPLPVIRLEASSLSQDVVKEVAEDATEAVVKTVLGEWWAGGLPREVNGDVDMRRVDSLYGNCHNILGTDWRQLLKQHIKGFLQERISAGDRDIAAGRRLELLALFPGEHQRVSALMDFIALANPGSGKPAADIGKEADNSSIAAEFEVGVNGPVAKSDDEDSDLTDDDGEDGYGPIATSSLEPTEKMSDALRRYYRSLEDEEDRVVKYLEDEEDRVLKFLEYEENRELVGNEIDVWQRVNGGTPPDVPPFEVTPPRRGVDVARSLAMSSGNPGAAALAQGAADAPAVPNAVAVKGAGEVAPAPVKETSDGADEELDRIRRQAHVRWEKASRTTPGSFAADTATEHQQASKEEKSEEKVERKAGGPRVDMRQGRAVLHTPSPKPNQAPPAKDESDSGEVEVKVSGAPIKAVKEIEIVDADEPQASSKKASGPSVFRYKRAWDAIQTQGLNKEDQSFVAGSAVKGGLSSLADDSVPLLHVAPAATSQGSVQADAQPSAVPEKTLEASNGTKTKDLNRENPSYVAGAAVEGGVASLLRDYAGIPPPPQGVPEAAVAPVTAPLAAESAPPMTKDIDVSFEEEAPPKGLHPEDTAHAAGSAVEGGLTSLTLNAVSLPHPVNADAKTPVADGPVHTLAAATADPAAAGKGAGEGEAQPQPTAGAVTDEDGFEVLVDIVGENQLLRTKTLYADSPRMFKNNKEVTPSVPIRSFPVPLLSEDEQEDEDQENEEPGGGSESPSGRPGDQGGRYRMRFRF